MGGETREKMNARTVEKKGQTCIIYKCTNSTHTPSFSPFHPGLASWKELFSHPL